MRTTSNGTSLAHSRRSGGRGLRVVVDTNVWVSGLIDPDSVPGRVLDLVRQRRVTAVASWQLAEEIVEVLGRPRLRTYGITDDDVDDILTLLAPLLPDVDVDVETRDPDDAPVVATAVAGAADVIVSGDRGLPDDTRLRRWLRERGVEILAPADFLRRL